MPAAHAILLLLAFVISKPLTANTSDQEVFEFVHCYDFGCKSMQNIRFTQQQWSAIDAVFSPPALSSWMEKQQIRQAIALMETYSGGLTGTHLDQGGNYNGVDLPRQQDCIDESTNTLQYLNALLTRRLLHWHDLAAKKRRIVWLATHWTAVIREKSSKQLYAVDSWYRDNGQPPYFQPLADWQRKREFPPRLNP